MEYIRTNKLRVKSSTGNTLREPTEVRLGSTKKYRLMKGNDVVWDVLQTTFSASDFSIGANGGDVKSNSNVTSYGVNALGTKEPLGWVCSPTTISANSSTSSKTHTITYTQNDTGDTTTAVCTQAAAVLNWTVSSYATTPTVPASGGTVSVTIHWDLYLNGTYYKSGTSSPSRVWLDGVYQGTSTVSVGSAGTTHYANAHVVGYITNYEFYADGHFFDIYRNDAVYRAANTLGTKTYTYNVSLTKNEPNKTFTSSGGTTKIKVTSTRSWSATWSSGSPASGTEDYSATLSATNGTVNKSSVSGTNVEVTLTVGNNGDTDRTITVTATAGGTSKSVSYSQSKRVEKSKDYDPPSGTPSPISTVAVTGGTVYLKIASWTQSYTITYDNGTTSTGSTSGTNTSATVTNGSGINGTEIKNGGVSIPNAGTSYYTTDRTAYTITGYSFTANGKTANVTTSIAIKQKANNRKETPEYYVGLVSQSTTSIGNTGGTFTFTAESLKRTKYTYDTTQTAYSAYSNYSASVTYSNGVIKVSSSTISGKQTVTVTVGSNYDNVKTPKVVVTSQGDNSKSISITVTQAAAVYDFNFADPGIIDAYGGTYNIALTSKVNGSFMEVIPESVKLSEGTVNKITENASESKYNVNVTFPANSSTTNTKSYVIQAQQYNTGKTTQCTITQAKKTSSYVTGRVSISSLVSGLYISSDGMLGGFNQYPTFTITASSNGWVNKCKYIFCLDFEIQTSNGQTFNPRYEHQLDYIEFSAFSGTKTVQFINFPTNFNLQDLTNYQFDPYYSNAVSVRIIADIQPVISENMGELMLSQNYTWTVY